MLVDMSASPVQPRHVTSIIAAMIADAQQNGLTKAAVVGATALKSLQAERIQSALRTAYFVSLTEALAWLEATPGAPLSGDEPA